MENKLPDKKGGGGEEKCGENKALEVISAG